MDTGVDMGPNGVPPVVTGGGYSELGWTMNQAAKASFTNRKAAEVELFRSIRRVSELRGEGP